MEKLSKMISMIAMLSLFQTSFVQAQEAGTFESDAAMAYAHDLGEMRKALLEQNTEIRNQKIQEVSVQMSATNDAIRDRIAANNFNEDAYFDAIAAQNVLSEEFVSKIRDMGADKFSSLKPDSQEAVNLMSEALVNGNHLQVGDMVIDIKWKDVFIILLLLAIFF